MERRIYHYISLLLLICFSVSSCREIEIETLDDSMYIELNVSCVNLSETRATTDNDNTLNENKIETLHYFLYPTGKTNQNAVLAGKFESSQLIDSKIQIQINEGILNDELIPYPNITCEVFLVANLPSDVTINTSTRENTSLPELEAKVITTDFKDKTFKPQSSFVMTGKNTANLLSRKKANAVQGTIELKRLAAKYTVRISVDKTFTDTEGETWKAEVDNMTVHVAKAVNKTTLSGNFGKDYFDYSDRKHDRNPVTEDNKTKYVFDPFYSYPCQWDLRGDNAFVMFVILPWKKEGDEGYTPYYYKVLPNTTKLDRNCWYNVDLHIGVLGSINQKEVEVNLTGTYSVMDWNNGSSEWSTGVNESTSIQGAQYLIVDKNHYVVNNQDEFEIPFRTSHPCKIKDLAITRTVFGNTNSSKPTESPITTSEVTENIHYQIGSNTNDWLKIEGNTIKLRHALKNDFINSDDYDYSPYTITFTLCHINNEQKFYESIKITQKPALTITAHLNSLYENTNGGTKSGYVYVNGITNNSGSYGGVADVNSSGNNSNPYMYTIEVSVLPAGSDYILGDPRILYSFGTDLDARNSFAEAPPIDGGTNRRLSNYYGTIKDASAENMIAPKFRINSAHGRLPSLITHKNALNRAASYQEDGYPAGRWRVPTKAEVSFVYKLYIDDLIPPLFYEGTEYWCANGVIQSSNNKVEHTTSFSTTETHPVRCVYDEWYWENSTWPRMPERKNNNGEVRDHPNKYNQFTWGDE